MEKHPDLDIYQERPADAAVAEVDEDRVFRYSVLADPTLRLEYVQLTSELIDRVLAEKPDTLLFLDKSARPVYWLMRELWPMLATSHNVDDKTVETPPMPDVKFVNIDRGVWIKKTGGLEDDEGGRVQVDTSTVGREINNLRAAYLMNHAEVAKRGQEAKNRAYLDNQKIMIVDEVKVSGNTLEMAKQFYEQAFPTSVILHEHWMHSPIGQDGSGSRFNEEVPIWYSEESALGRGIGDLNPAANQQSTNARIRRGNKFFSSRLTKPDVMSMSLRREMKQLPDEIAAGLLPLRLNTLDIPPEILEQRLKFMEAVNHGVTAKELTDIIAKTKNKPEKFLALYNAAKKF